MLRSGHFTDADGESSAAPSSGFEARLRKSWEEHAQKEAEAAAAKEAGTGFRSELGDAAYWEGLYASRTEDATSGKEVYDWLLSWADLQFLIEPLMGHDHSCPVLHLGVGNSILPEEMYDVGYTNQTSVDVSPSVVEQMKDRNLQSRPSMRWIAADCSDMEGHLGNDEFRLAIDKSCADALFCNDAHVLVVTKYLKEASRVTREGGVFLCISVHSPKDMLPWLNRKAYGWKVRSVPLPSQSTAYICSKQKATEECLRKYWPALLQQAEDEKHEDDWGLE